MFKTVLGAEHRPEAVARALPHPGGLAQADKAKLVVPRAREIFGGGERQGAEPMAVATLALGGVRTRSCDPPAAPSPPQH